MLKGIPRIISPELMKVMMEMGHGDEIVLADGNFPSVSCAKRLVRCDGHNIPELLHAIMPFFPLDQAVKQPVGLMASAPGESEPEIWQEYRQVLDEEFEYIERFAFYERAKQAFAVVATGEQTRKANIILKKGVVR